MLNNALSESAHSPPGPPSINATIARPKSDGLKATTRNFLGVVSEGATEAHLEHATQRRAGRDRTSGFRTPFGVDYKAVGGEVSIAPGDVIKASLLPEGFAPRIKPPPAVKIPLPLDATIVHDSRSYRFTYYEVDLTDRPLHASPARTLHITWSATQPGGIEIHFAMSESHPLPDRAACDWSPPASAGELVVLPTDARYRAARDKRVTVAVRGGAAGAPACRLRAETRAFLSQQLERLRLLGRRTAGRADDDRRAAQRSEIRGAIADSALRATRARSGLRAPAPGPRPDAAPAPRRPAAGAPAAAAGPGEEGDGDAGDAGDGDDLDDVPLRADGPGPFAMRGRPLSEFLGSVLDNVEADATRAFRSAPPRPAPPAGAARPARPRVLVRPGGIGSRGARRACARRAARAAAPQRRLRFGA
jgi:hypothetical protein